MSSAEITGTNIYTSQAIASIITGNSINVSSFTTSLSFKTDTIVSYTSNQPISVAGLKFNYSDVLALSRLITTQPLATRAVTSWTTSSAGSSRIEMIFVGLQNSIFSVAYRQ